ncbi:D-arabinono-1,4-lactone oxidase [Kibdelosporangium phytohabitans]|uniref:FAD-linked oxidoreductase n=1 Tax=Kibdelosporangium phytohabitans TaxID=860235 RepID=A0A0N9HUN6_9PSEU|nr:D-arabinono-1,4-lactone oxidase [Kibdelosporangium phytohabitans]ALG05556.1 FAD-linked oxidoreductase [Kibdelosporangium phytohabitans]MBE1466485.1 FAD-linked oxidoreductase [Kibdelosporangium phytohabitans]
MTALRTSADGQIRWTNWARNEIAAPQTVSRPASVEQISEAVTTATAKRLPVKAIGAGHSFTAIAAAHASAAIDLSSWTGVESSDVGSGLVTVRAGTTIKQLNAALDRLGLALINLGDIDAQTIAGAISTGTHGTGAKLGGISTQVTALQLVLADGSVVTCSADERPDLFHAARVGLGALGVISTVTLRCERSFSLHADERPVALEEVIERLDELITGHDHMEFYWFPYGRKALVKRNDRLPLDAAARPLSRAREFYEYTVMENVVWGAMCRAARAVPKLVKPLNGLASIALSPRSYSDLSHRVFVTERNVRFVESEYAVPRESLVDVLNELRAVVPTLTHPVMMPVEVRVAAADDIWLSTAYQRDSTYFAIHQYPGMPYREYFDAFEKIVAQVGGRPHWGKMHTLDAEALRARYPRFDDFRRVRAEVDPGCVFRNAYLDRVLALT